MINAEVLTVEHVNAQAGRPADAFMDVPANRPQRFVTVERVGGGRDTHRDLPLLAVQCWAESRWHASELAAEVVDILELLAFHPHVARVRVNSAYNFPDPDSPKLGRYQITVEMVTKE